MPLRRAMRALLTRIETGPTLSGQIRAAARRPTGSKAAAGARGRLTIVKNRNIMVSRAGSIFID